MRGEGENRLKLNRTSQCTLCQGERRRRQTSADVQHDVFFICPVCDQSAPSKEETA